MSSHTKMPKPLFDAAHALGESRIISGKYIGDCPKCRLVLAAFDPISISLQVKCPRCEAKSPVAELLKQGVKVPTYATKT